MRYLAQVARETTARVLPRRSPSWAPPSLLTEQDTLVEWPTLNSQAATPARTETASEPSASGNTWQEEKPAERAPLAPAARRPETSGFAAPRPRIVSAKFPARSPEGPVPSPVREIEEVPKPRKIDVNRQAEVPMSLSGVLAEIARRQELLEARYRSDESSGESSPRPQNPPAEITNPATAAWPEAEDVRLNIGSIVVQLEPSPGPVAAPQVPAPRRPVPQPVRRWARSFLDR